MLPSASSASKEHPMTVHNSWTPRPSHCDSRRATVSLPSSRPCDYAQYRPARSPTRTRSTISTPHSPELGIAIIPCTRDDDGRRASGAPHCLGRAHSSPWGHFCSSLTPRRGCRDRVWWKQLLVVHSCFPLQEPLELSRQVEHVSCNRMREIQEVSCVFRTDSFL